ncbi:gustatory receptor for sugar taste 64e-like [Diabrotica virgifera virgifera]|uniref:Gustatory receptor n=1 Tax=Diabrotica virgifera virgifera TaxID=50390 RepID=A0ABM5L7D2_DIAVI|nr:gustatory receptor for sugar taste 64e-like [Diabrotica virgifera virgifera]XP_050518352.1 gustatory receptor for sugar taste 64e-like [Diabrotica virgifera virgifera]
MVYIVGRNRIEDSDKKPVQIDVEEKLFHNSMRLFLIMCQILGLFPINCSTKYYTDVKFSWKSFRIVYTFFMIVIIAFAVFVCLYSWATYGYKFADAGTHTFYVASLLSILLFLRLSKRWVKLLTTWCQMDKLMNRRYGYPSTIEKRLKICSVVFLTLVIIDHLLSIYNRFCRVKESFGINYNYKYFFIDTFPHLFMVVPANVFTAVYCLFLNTHATLILAFNDLFIILVSVTLALRFRQITEKLEKDFSKFHAKTEEFWMEIREDFDRLSSLCKELDNNISYIILLSYTMNLFFLLMQLYLSLEVGSNTVGKVYFIFSFVYIIFKIVMVSLYAAWINDESLEPANILNSVSSSCYNIEVKRLLMQIGFDNVALTGCRLFKITRGIILSIAGAVVTYELVLIQFNSATQGN